MSKYFKENDKVFVAPNGAKEIFDHLPLGVYMLRHSPLMGYYLENSGNFSIPEKIFGNSKKRAERVLKTYFARNCNTGVLLSGDKGSGKTMFARLLSIKALEKGIPTVIVNDSFGSDIGFNKFLTDIDDRCLILFDEFEKTFIDEVEQNKILALFDGTYQSNKLFVLTANNTYKISDFILNRPGRVYYHFRYSGIEEDFIREFCDYHLKNKAHIESFVNLSKLIGRFNFDMLQAVVQECNIHDESPAEIYELMNIDLDGVRDKFSFTITKLSTGEKQTGQIKTSIYDEIYVYWHVNKDKDEFDDDGDDDDRDIELYFSNDDFSCFDRNSGLFVYEKDNFKLELRREKSVRNSFAF